MSFIIQGFQEDGKTIQYIGPFKNYADAVYWKWNHTHHPESSMVIELVIPNLE